MVKAQRELIFPEFSVTELKYIIWGTQLQNRRQRSNEFKDGKNHSTNWEKVRDYLKGLQHLLCVQVKSVASKGKEIQSRRQVAKLSFTDDIRILIEKNLKTSSK